MVKQRTKNLTTMGVLCAIAFLVVAVLRIRVFGFLTYDAKDVIITLGGFFFGPLSALVISLVVSLVEMITISDTGPYGLIMNIIASCSFACTASLIYKYKRTMFGAIIGLLVGVVAGTGVMVLWNYIITPLYMGVERSEVAGMLATVFLPFNLVKYSLNAAITIIIYKPVIRALRKANLLPASQGGGGARSKAFNVGVMIAAAMVLITSLLFVLIFAKVI